MGPIPIVGSWLKAVSCIYGSMDQMIKPVMEEQCQSELGILSACLPEDINESNCHDTLNKCVFDIGDMPSISMVLPPPFWAPPMSEQCKTVGATKHASVLERYETFRSVCIPADDRSVWDIIPDGKEDTTSGDGAWSDCWRLRKKAK